MYIIYGILTMALFSSLYVTFALPWVAHAHTNPCLLLASCVACAPCFFPTPLLYTMNIDFWKLDYRYWKIRNFTWKIGKNKNCTWTMGKKTVENIYRKWINNCYVERMKSNAKWLIGETTYCMRNYGNAIFITGRSTYGHIHWNMKIGLDAPDSRTMHAWHWRIEIWM